MGFIGLFSRSIKLLCGVTGMDFPSPWSPKRCPWFASPKVIPLRRSKQKKKSGPTKNVPFHGKGASMVAKKKKKHTIS